MTILQRAYDIVKRLSLEEQNANDFLNKKSQLKTFLNKYQNQQDKTVFKLLSQINHAIFVEEGHKLIPHLAEIDAIRSKNLNNINELKKGRVYKQGDEKGQLRNNFYSIVKNLTGENRKKMLQRMEEFYP
jgi:methionine salvage enolase-phosphatase E1